MIYMVEQDFPHPELLGEWNDWYAGYIERLLTVPGFQSVQRFHSVIPTISSFTAIYNLADQHVLTSDSYKSAFGPQATGRWRSLMSNWHRNLFEGIEWFGAVPIDACLAIVDRATAEAPPIPEGYACMRPCGLDRSVAERGLMCVGDVDDLVHPGPRNGLRLRLMTPMTAWASAPKS